MPCLHPLCPQVHEAGCPAWGKDDEGTPGSDEGTHGRSLPSPATEDALFQWPPRTRWRVARPLAQSQHTEVGVDGLLSLYDVIVCTFNVFCYAETHVDSWKYT